MCAYHHYPLPNTQQLSPQILKNIHWYTERSISEISLGGLLILVVIRTIQYNMLKMRDKYLHTNCLAALANMSGQFRSLHPYVAQRLVSLFETLAKKHARLDQQLKQPVNGTPIVELTDSSMVLSDDMVSGMDEMIFVNISIWTSPFTATRFECRRGSPANGPRNIKFMSFQSAGLLSEFGVHTSLQTAGVWNVSQSSSLSGYYSKYWHGLWRKFESFIVLSNRLDLLSLQVVGFFSSRLQRVQDQRGELGVNEVLEVISKGASQWSSDRLRVSLFKCQNFNCFVECLALSCWVIINIQEFFELYQFC